MVFDHDRVEDEERSGQRQWKLKADQTKKEEVDEEDFGMTVYDLPSSRSLVEKLEVAYLDAQNLLLRARPVTPELLYRFCHLNFSNRFHLQLLSLTVSTMSLTYHYYPLYPSSSREQQPRPFPSCSFPFSFLPPASLHCPHLPPSVSLLALVVSENRVR